MNAIDSAEERLTRLVDDIKSVGEHGEIKIFAGEGNCFVYDDHRVYDAFVNAKKRNVKITMIIGPILSVCEETGTSRLARLVEEVIEMYPRPYRHTLPHYRVMKDSRKKRIYMESPHNSLETPHEGVVHENNLWCEKLDSDFDDFIREYSLKPSRDIQEGLVYLKPSQISEVKKRASKKNRDMDYLTRSEIDELLETQH